MDDNLLLEPAASSGMTTVISLEEAVKQISSGPWSRSGIWPVATGTEHR